jgi:UDP-glucose 4-epimerase
MSWRSSIDRRGDTIAVNSGTGHGASVRQVADTARRITDVRSLRDATRRAGDPPNCGRPEQGWRSVGLGAEQSDLAAIITDARAGITKNLQQGHSRRRVSRKPLKRLEFRQPYYLDRR